MIMPVDNPLRLAKCKAIAVKNILFGAREAQEKFIRQYFDNACVEPTALAAIEVAKSLGFPDLAEELQNDFYVKTGKEVCA